MGDSGQYLVGQPSVLFTAIFAARVISSSPRCFMESRWQTHSMLTRTSHFTPNKSGIGISVLCNRCFISITSQFSWAGGGQRYRNDFSENHFVNLRHLVHSTDSHVTRRCQNYVTTMQIHRGTYQLQNDVSCRGLRQLLSILQLFSNITPKF